MLKLKKIFLAMMVAALAVTGFVSCSNDDDEENTPEYAQYYGDYSGSMTVIGTAVALTATVAENSITLSGNYGTYTPAFWFKDSNSKWVVAGRTKTNTETDVTVDNYTDKSVCGVYITFGDSVVMTIPPMASMGGTSTLTKSE